MLSEKTFKEVISNLKEYQEKENALYDNDLDISVVTESLIRSIFSLLKETTGDESELISYFCYDLDFGKDWYVGCCTDDETDADIKLETVQDLYNVLLNDEARRNMRDKELGTC